jgi:hypothetical protein
MRRYGLGWEHWEEATSRATGWAAGGAVAAIAGLVAGSGLLELLSPYDLWLYNIDQDFRGVAGVMVACGLSALVVGAVLTRGTTGVEQPQGDLSSGTDADRPRRRRVII